MTNDNLVSGLGGPAGYGEIVVSRNDDGASRYDISSIFPDGFAIDGELISSDAFWVSTNGYVQFGGAAYHFDYDFGLYLPVPSTFPWIAPYAIDLQTSLGASPVESGEIYVDLDTDNDVVTVTWDQVGRFYLNTDPPFSFQLQLARGVGNEVNVTVRYGDMELYELYPTALIGAELGSQGFESDLPDTVSPADFDTTLGNTGEAGVWEYTFSLLPIVGTDDNDVLLGTDGPDTILGKDGDDDLQGFGGNDFINGGWDHDLIDGGAGNDVLLGKSGTDTINGGFGNDDIDGGLGPDIIDGGVGDDLIKGGDGYDTMFGRAGQDEMYGEVGGDTMYGGQDDDFLSGDGGNDVLYGDDGNDVLQGGDGADALSGGTGDDDIQGNAGNDTLYGNAGRDTLNGGTHDDQIYGGSNNDVLIGGLGFDTLFGGGGQDRLHGNAGNDVLRGNHGDDLMNGGAGADVFMFDTGNDLIVDLQTTIDRVEVNLTTVGGAPLDAATLEAAATVVGSDTVFDFGDGNSLTFQGQTDVALLANLIEFF